MPPVLARKKTLLWSTTLVLLLVLAWIAYQFQWNSDVNNEGSAAKPAANARFVMNKVPSEGLVFIEDGKSEIRNARIKIGDQEGFMDSQEIFRVEIVNLIVRDCTVTKERRKYLKGERSDRIQIGEQVLPEFEIEPLLGETVEREADGGELRQSLVGKKPNQKQTPRLRTLPITPEFKWFPEEPIAVGARWSIDARKVKNYPESFETVDSGTWTCHFRGIEAIDGEDCAVIPEEVDISGKGRFDGGELKLSFRGSIKAWRSFSDHLIRKEVLEGVLTSQGSLPNGTPTSFSGKVRTVTTRAPK